ncbi:glycosyltransferase [Bacterioplanoides sp.]|uniref:glycosyltransferase n=1 Tax=Bacterioplanoides sp. TaxID=2066072 RepID=UPI003B00EEF7
MKTILYVLSEFPVASETFVTTEIKAIERQGHRVVPVCLIRRDEPCQAGDEGLAECFLSLADVSVITLLNCLILWVFDVVVALLKGDEYLSSLLSAWRFAQQQEGVRTRSVLLNGFKLMCLLKRHQGQHIHCHFAWSPAVMGITAARLSGVSVSFTSHGSDVYKTPQNLQSKLQNADFVVAVCKRMHDEFQAISPETPVVHIPCGVDTQTFYPRYSCSDKQGSPKEKKNQKTNNQEKNNKLLFLGRLSETKGLPDLIQAMTQLPATTHIDIAGAGPMQQQLTEQVEQLGLQQQVHFLGAVSRQWVSEHISAYQALVLPFCKTSEGIMDTGPLVLKEAMASKIPIVTTDLMATGEILDEYSGWIAKHNDPHSLACTLQQLLDDLADPDKGQQRIHLKTGLAYHQVKTRFSADVCAAQLSRQFQAVGAAKWVEEVRHEN